MNLCLCSVLVVLAILPFGKSQFFPGIFGNNQQPVGMTGDGGMNIPTDGLSLLTGGAAGGTVHLNNGGGVSTSQGFGPFGGANQNWFGGGRRRRSMSKFLHRRK